MRRGARAHQVGDRRVHLARKRDEHEVLVAEPEPQRAHDRARGRTRRHRLERQDDELAQNVRGRFDPRAARVRVVLVPRAGDLAAREERKTRFAAARAPVTDCRRAAFIFVVTPEWLPVLETDRAVETLRRYGIPVGAVLVNRVVPDEADGAFVARLRRDQASMRAEIVRRFATVPVKEIPLLERDVRGPDALHTLVSLLAPDTSGGAG